MLSPLKLQLPCALRLVTVTMSHLAFLMGLSPILWSIANFTMVVSLSFRVMTQSSLRKCVCLPIPGSLSLTLLLSSKTVLCTIFVSLWKNRILFVVTTLSARPVRSFFVVLSPLKLTMMTRRKSDPYFGCTVTLPEPLAAIRRPGVRLCLDEPVEVVTALSRFCVPVCTLSSDIELTSKIKSYAHYFHTISCHNGPDIVVSYLTMPRFVLALRHDSAFRALVLTAPLCVSEG